MDRRIHQTFGLGLALVLVLLYCGGGSRVIAESYLKPSSQLCIGAIDLVAELSSARGPALVKVLETLQTVIEPINSDGKHTNAWVSAETSRTMGSKDVGLLSALVSVILLDNGEARRKALGILKILSDDIMNIKNFLSRELGFFPALVSVISNDYGNDDSKVALGIFTRVMFISEIFFYFGKEDLIYLASKDLGLLSTMCKNDFTSSGPFHYPFEYFKIGTLKILSQLDENKVYMGSRELGLVSILVGKLPDPINSREIMEILESLSTEPENKLYMGSKELGLVSTLVNLLRHPATFLDFERALKILENLFEEPVNRAYIRSEVVPILQDTISADARNSKRVLALLTEGTAEKGDSIEPPTTACQSTLLLVPTTSTTTPPPSLPLATDANPPLSTQPLNAACPAPLLLLLPHQRCLSVNSSNSNCTAMVDSNDEKSTMTLVFRIRTTDTSTGHRKFECSENDVIKLMKLIDDSDFLSTDSSQPTDHSSSDLQQSDILLPDPTPPPVNQQQSMYVSEDTIILPFGTSAAEVLQPTTTHPTDLSAALLQPTAKSTVPYSSAHPDGSITSMDASTSSTSTASNLLATNVSDPSTTTDLLAARPMEPAATAAAAAANLQSNQQASETPTGLQSSDLLLVPPPPAQPTSPDASPQRSASIKIDLLAASPMEPAASSILSDFLRIPSPAKPTVIYYASLHPAFVTIHPAGPFNAMVVHATDTSTTTDTDDATTTTELQPNKKQATQTLTGLPAGLRVHIIPPPPQDMLEEVTSFRQNRRRRYCEVKWFLSDPSSRPAAGPVDQVVLKASFGCVRYNGGELADLSWDPADFEYYRLL